MKADNKIDLFEFTVLSFTVYILFSIVWQTFWNVDREVAKILDLFDLISCVIFLIDWFGRLRYSDKKLKFALINSLDLIASIPLLFLFDYFKEYEFIRFIQFIKVIKIIGGVSRIIYYIKTDQIYSFKLLYSLFFIAIIISAPILILEVERGIGNIKTAEQSLWWTYCTFTTIGYGDFFPSTTAGRVIAVLVSLGGIGMFGMISSLILEHFTKHKND